MKRQNVVLAASVIAIATIVLTTLRWALATEVTATISFERGSPELALEVTHVDDGTMVDVLGQRVAVRDDRATITLREDALRPGRNDIHAMVDGVRYPLAIEIPFSVVSDTELLSTDPPRVGVVVRATPGDSVTVDGGPVPLDERGVGRASAPATSDGSPVERTFLVVCQRGDERFSRTVLVRASPASLVVRQPPSGFVTDRASVELDATVASSARVEVDGRPISASAGRVRASLILPRDGDYRFRIDVLEPGRLRRVEHIVIHRVHDLVAAAAGFTADAALDYPTLARETSSRLGRRVALRGRVTNLRVDRGRSYFEIAVAPCAAAACPLHVEYPATTTLHLDDLVTVRGVVSGVEASNGPSRPRVDAEFVTAEAL